MSKWDRVVKALSPSSLYCPECKINGCMTLEHIKPNIVSCMHCKGEYTVEEGDRLEPLQYSNVRPSYLEEWV